MISRPLFNTKAAFLPFYWKVTGMAIMTASYDIFCIFLVVRTILSFRDRVMFYYTDDWNEQLDQDTVFIYRLHAQTRMKYKYLRRISAGCPIKKYPDRGDHNQNLNELHSTNEGIIQSVKNHVYHMNQIYDILLQNISELYNNDRVYCHIMFWTIDEPNTHFLNVLLVFHRTIMRLL